jgi:hypothetical protein
LPLANCREYPDLPGALACLDKYKPGASGNHSGKINPLRGGDIILPATNITTQHAIHHIHFTTCKICVTSQMRTVEPRIPPSHAINLLL